MANSCKSILFVTISVCILASTNILVLSSPIPVAQVAAAPPPQEGPEILKYSEGQSSRQEQGTPGKKVTGQWSWVDDTGRTHKIWYIADEFGFQAFGDLVPTAPPTQLATATENPKNNLANEQNLGNNQGIVEHTVPELQDSSNTKSVSSSNVPKTAKMISGDVSGNIQDLLNVALPNAIEGTNFVLIDRLQPPTIPKSRTAPIRITPVKVDVSDPITSVISGQHTSTRSKSIVMNSNSQNSIPLRTQQVPRPLRVVGELNFDTFLSPFKTTTPRPFQLDSLSDYYYDYDYYDYDTTTNATTANTTNTTPTTVAPNSTPIDLQSIPTVNNMLANSLTAVTRDVRSDPGMPDDMIPSTTASTTSITSTNSPLEPKSTQSTLNIVPDKLSFPSNEPAQFSLRQMSPESDDRMTFSSDSSQSAEHGDESDEENDENSEEED